MSTQQINRQMSRFAVMELGPSNAGTGNGFTAKLPQGALFLRLVFLTVVAFDGTGTVTGTVSDGTTTFVNAVDVKSTGSETVANTPKYYASGGTLTLSLADQNSNSSVGQVIAAAEYVLNGGGDEIYG